LINLLKRLRPRWLFSLNRLSAARALNKPQLMTCSARSAGKTGAVAREFDRD